MKFLLLLAPVLGIALNLGDFPYPLHSDYSDLAISHYPNAIFLTQTIREYGQIPLWSPAIFSGYPFFANPLSGLYYPPGWLALLFSLPEGFNLTVILHLLMGAAGMYLFLRAEGLEEWPALLGALVFESLPRWGAHYAAGHLTFSYAVAWTPWLLLAAHSHPRQWSRNRFFYEGFVLTAIILADARWAAYAGVLWGGYCLWDGLRARRINIRWLAGMAGQPLLALLLSSPFLLPLAEYTRLSTRAWMTAEENLSFSLPPGRLLGLISPNLDGNTEWTVYAGGFALLALLWTLGHARLRKQSAFWLMIVFLALVFSLGSAIPGMAFLARLPGFSLLRVPSRFLLIAGFGLAILSANLLDHLSLAENGREKAAFWSRLLVAGVTGFAGLIALGAWQVTGKIQFNLWWGFGGLCLALILITLRDRGIVAVAAWNWLAAALVLADLITINSLSVHFRPADEVLSEGQVAVDYLARQPGIFRVYTPSYSLPQQTAALRGLGMVNGVDPLQLLVYARWIDRIQGNASERYSVVLPPVRDEDISTGNAGLSLDTEALGQLNACYVAAEYDIDQARLELLQRAGATRIYRNRDCRPYAYLEGGAGAENIAITPNQITLEVEGPGRLVLAEIAYPGWRVRVDGQPARIVTVDGLLRGAEVGPGYHRVSFTFVPLSLIAGCGLALLAQAGLLLRSWQINRRGHHART